MLQPRTLCFQCRSFVSTFHRTLATVAQSPVQAAVETEDAFALASPPRSGTIRQAASDKIKTYKPQTPGLRHLRRPINEHLWKGPPFRPLTFPKTGHGKGGRNNTGKVTVRHHGGGHRRRIRTVDFKRMIPGRHLVERIEYDPNRSAHLALLENIKTKIKSYIIAAEGMRAGDVIESFRAGISPEVMKSMGGVIDPGVLAAKTVFRGNCLPLHLIPNGTQVYCVGLYPKAGAAMCRSAGTYATVVAREEEGKYSGYVHVRLQSGEVRRLHKDVCATIGEASNAHWQFRQLGKAGRSRWLNIRPTVRGVAMNANEHPHGGGRGKSKGNKPPRSPWGTLAKSNFKTRRKRKPTRHVVRERPRTQGRRTKNS